MPETDATWGPEDDSDDTTVRLRGQRKRKAPARTKASEKRARKVKGTVAAQGVSSERAEAEDSETDVKQRRWAIA